MATEIVIPRMGLTMEEGILLGWLKEEGETVEKGDPLFEIETDKATVEIEAPSDGILVPGNIELGTKLSVGTVIGYLKEEGERVTFSPPVSPTETKIKNQDQAGNIRDINVGISKAMASPAARSLAKKHDIDLKNIEGTGPGGRVVAWNVKEVIQRSRQGVKVSPLAQKIADDLKVDLLDIKGSGPAGRIMRKDVEEEAKSGFSKSDLGVLEPLTRYEEIIAERMITSFKNAPHFYLHTEVDVRKIVALRKKLLPRLKEQTGMHLTYTDLIIKLCALALVEHPRMMTQWADGKRRSLQNANIALAVDTTDGLMVPVIHHADKMGLAGIAERRQEIVQRARTGKLLPQDVELGVMTISNLGMFRVDAFQAILNPPQGVILAAGRMKERPFVENDKIISATTMNLSLSIDHRVIDGATAARFLGDLAELMEMPGLALA